MKEQMEEQKPTLESSADSITTAPRKKAMFWGVAIGVIGIVLTVAMVVAIIYYREELNELKQFGYIGAFFISILGGATVIVPVPMLALVFALGSTMEFPWLVGLSAALGELIGALTIYMTGTGAGHALSQVKKHGRIQAAYERMLGLMERKGPLTLFIVASVVNPFFYPAALAAGALRFGLRKYIVIVFAGKVIKCMTVVYAGYFGLKGIFRALGIEL